MTRCTKKRKLDHSLHSPEQAQMTDQATTIDMQAPAFRADPYPFYARMRRETPVFKTHIPGFGRDAFVVTRYDDIVAALKNPALSSDMMRGRSVGGWGRWVPRAFRILAKTMVTMDDPDHARLRNLVHKGFTPSMVDRMAGRVQEIADELLAKLEGKDTVDLLHDFALAAADDRDLGNAGRAGEPARQVPPFHAASAGRAAAQRLAADHRHAQQHPHDQLPRRADQSAPQAEPDNGLITALVAAEQSGDRLTQDELVGMVFLLLLAGHETTVNLLGNGVLALMDNRASWKSSAPTRR
jgi:cytochrome P450